jgi:uncharacterized protein YggE
MLRTLYLATALSLSTAIAYAADVPTLSLQATGIASIAPDMAGVQLTVLRDAKTAAQALRANSEAMSEVLAEMKAQGVEERDLQTTNFNIQPIYERLKSNSSGSRRTPRIIGYSVSNGLHVRVRDLDNLGNVLDRAVTLGVNSGGGITFQSSKAEEARKEARINAVKAALEKAQTMADTANFRLGRIVSMSESGGALPPMRARVQMQGMQKEANFAVPIAAGEGSYSITVNVQWEITS